MEDNPEFQIGTLLKNVSGNITLAIYCKTSFNMVLVNPKEIMLVVDNKKYKSTDFVHQIPEGGPKFSSSAHFIIILFGDKLCYACTRIFPHFEEVVLENNNSCV